jgi:hypothetical protein
MAIWLISRALSGQSLVAFSRPLTSTSSVLYAPSSNSLQTPCGETHLRRADLSEAVRLSGSILPTAMTDACAWTSEEANPGQVQGLEEEMDGSS